MIIRGWVPELLLPLALPGHIGSTDVDLALDHRRITEVGCQTIHEHCLRHGYVAGSQPLIFFREVAVAGRPIPVKVDFLAGEYGGAGRSHRTQHVQPEFEAIKARLIGTGAFSSDERIVQRLYYRSGSAGKGSPLGLLACPARRTLVPSLGDRNG